MKIVRGLSRLGGFLKGSVVTIGVFDGVHIGHRSVIRRVVERAHKLKLKSVILTFDPHPLKILRPASKIPSLISLSHRTKLIRELGADTLIVVNFTKSFARLSPGTFLKDVLVKRLGSREAYVGSNFYFGRGASADVNKFKNLAKSYGIRIKIVRPVKVSGKVVSSSLIRKLISKGDLGPASRLLGRRVSVFGTVVSGANLARELGYPTANINPHHEAVPPSGVYAVTADLAGKRLRGILNIGVRPTFYAPRDRESAIELHIFDFHERIYGREVEIFFVKKLRNEIKFAEKEALVAQIKKDEKKARAVLRRIY